MRSLALHRSDTAAALAAALAFFAWSGSRSPGAAAFFLALAWALFAAGDLLARRLPLDLGCAGRLLLGALSVSLVLTLSVWVSPLRMPGNAAILLAALAVERWMARPERRGQWEAPGLLAIFVALAAASLWSQDALSPISLSGDEYVFKPWLDGFVHAAYIRMLGRAHGAATLQDIQMAGERTYFYHFASYGLPSLIWSATPVTAWSAFAGFLVPSGILMTGLAAHVLFGSLFGRWPGLAAAWLLLCLPDAAQQGMRNRFFSFHWLLQVSPSLGWGIGMGAVAWTMIFAFLRNGRARLLAAGWGAGLLTMYVKAHIFFANALLLLAWPAIWMKEVRRARRLAWLGAIAACAVAGVFLSGRIRSAPEIRFDPLSTKKYLNIILGAQQPALFPLPSFPPQSGYLHDAAEGALYLLAVTLGAWLLLQIAAAVLLWRRAPRAEVLFPTAVIALYLATALGLALDNRSVVGTPEELLHRPFVWTYFVVAGWTCAALGSLVLGDRPPRRRVAVAAAGALLLLVPWRLGRGVQEGPPQGRDYVGLRVPAGVVEAAAFLRTQAGPDEIIEGSDRDPRFILTALAERPDFVVASGNAWHTPRMVERLVMMETFLALADERAVRDFARDHGIRWFVARPGAALRWPAAILDQPAFTSHGVRVYRLY